MSDENLKVQYGIFRQIGMTMEGPDYVQIVNAVFPTKEAAEDAVARVPRLSVTSPVIRRRLATDWEDVDE